MQGNNKVPVNSVQNSQSQVNKGNQRINNNQICDGW